MAKYDWKQLEKDYILSDCKSVKEFLRNNNIKSTGNTNKQTTGWADKKAIKEQQKSNKVIEKVIEKQSEKEANQIVNLKDIANTLAEKIILATNELDRHIARNKKKSKTIEYNYDMYKPSKEVIHETEEVTDYISIIDRKGIKELTSALKDLNDIIAPKEEENNDDNSFIEALKGKTEDVWDEEE